MHALHTLVTITGAGPTFDGRQGTIVNMECLLDESYQVKFADPSGLISDRFWFTPAEVQPIYTEVCVTAQSGAEVRRSVRGAGVRV